MIHPTQEDVGRRVLYTGNRYPGGKIEEGVITSFNDNAVFVRYTIGGPGIATSHDDLEWMVMS